MHTTDDKDLGPDDGQPDEKSKSQIKRELDELKDLGKQLLELSGKTLQTLPLWPELLTALQHGQRVQRGALARQVRYIGALLANQDAADIEAIRQALQELLQPHRRQVEVFHTAEQWRDRLLAGDEELLNELVEHHAADRQHVRQLLRNAAKESAENKPPKSARVLFQYLRDLESNK
jgi:ribosome-associated protein